MRKPKKVVKPRARIVTKTELVQHIQKMEAELKGAGQLIVALQTEVKQLTSMHRTQLQIIDNLSTQIRDRG